MLGARAAELTVVSVHARIDLRAVRCRALAGTKSIRAENPGEFDLELNNAVLVHGPVNAVLIVSSSKDLADDQLAGSCSRGRFVTCTDYGHIRDGLMLF